MKKIKYTNKAGLSRRTLIPRVILVSAVLFFGALGVYSFVTRPAFAVINQYDVDGDGVVNTSDSDDDNDGLADTIEGCTDSTTGGDDTVPTGMRFTYSFNSATTPL
jgi:hypothetical protein